MKTFSLATSCLFGALALGSSCKSLPNQQEAGVMASYKYCNVEDGANLPLESYAEGDTYELVDIQFDFGRLPFQPVCIAPVDFKIGDRTQVAIIDQKKALVTHQGRSINIGKACIGTNWDKSKRQVEYTGTVDLAQMTRNSDKKYEGNLFIYGEVSHAAADTLVIKEHLEYRAEAKCSYGFLGRGGDCFKVLDRYNIAMTWPVGKKVAFDDLENFGESEHHRWLKSIREEGACYSKYQLTYKKI